MSLKFKYAMALHYHKINVRRSTFYIESFMLFKSAQLSHYAALLLTRDPFANDRYYKAQYR